MFLLEFVFLSTLLADPEIVVTNVAEAKQLDPSTTALKLVLRDDATLGAILEHAPNITKLHLTHPGHRISLESLELLGKFKKLESLTFRGDPFLSDKKFTALGNLPRLKTLHLALP